MKIATTEEVHESLKKAKENLNMWDKKIDELFKDAGITRSFFKTDDTK